MKKFKFDKQTVKMLCAGTVLIGVLFMNSFSFAVEAPELQTSPTQQFVEWQKLSDEEKENTLLPRLYTDTVEEEVLEQYDKKTLSYNLKALTRNISEDWYESLVKAASYNQPSYNLNTDVKVKVKNQGRTNECWAFSTVTMLETNLALLKKTDKTFSPRHMDYSTIKTFTDGVNSYCYNREAGSGGLAPFGLAYLTNGRGAVLEEKMPFQDSTEKISLKELDQPVDTIVTDYVTLPILMKEYGNDGTVTYTNGGVGNKKHIYSNSEVTELRNMIKNHIVKYGAVSAVTAGNQAKFYNNQENPIKSTAYFCNSNSYVRDHAVTIVGWDDSYSRDNFTGAAKPKNNGAYICLNTYGTENFGNGYLYISYEDALIESMLYGIVSTSNVDYDKLYQYNQLGDNTAIGLDTTNEGYIGTVYSRDSSKKETLKYIGISVPDSVALEIYVNPKGNSTIINGLTKVATTDVLSPGYHRIDIDDVTLTESNFAIVVKQKSNSSKFYFSVEASVPNSLYSTIKGNPNKNMYSVDGYNWFMLSDQAVGGFDMKNTDLCIKAFTDVGSATPDNPDNPDKPDQPDNPDKPDKPDDPDDPDNPDKPDNPDNPDDPGEKITLSTSEYIIKSKDIYKIQPNTTTVKTFKSKITTNSKTVIIKDANGKTVSDNDLVKTGMTLTLSDGSVYTLIVRGDITGDGHIELLDFSKFIAHYMYGKEFTLKGNQLKAIDMNCDWKIDLTDLSQIVDIYMNT